MKENNRFNFNGAEELSLQECQETEGGFLALVISGAGLCVALYMAGLATGRAIF